MNPRHLFTFLLAGFSNRFFFKKLAVLVFKAASFFYLFYLF